MPTTTRLQVVVHPALATAAASTMVSPALHETAGSESAASCGPERRAAVSFETTSLVWSREASSRPGHIHYNNPLLLSLFKNHVHSHDYDDAIRATCIISIMHTGHHVHRRHYSSIYAVPSACKGATGSRPGEVVLFFSAFPYSTMTRHLNTRCKIPGPSTSEIYSPTPTSVYHVGGREYPRRLLLTSPRAHHEPTQSGMILIVFFLFILIDMYHYGSLFFLSPTHTCWEPFRLGKGTAFYYFSFVFIRP